MFKRYLASLSINNWLVIILMVGIPLLPKKFGLFNVPGTYVAIRLEDFVIGFLFMAWLFIMRFEIKRLLGDKMVQSLGIFLAVGGLSLISALFITQTVSPHLGLLHYLRRIEYVAPFLMVMTSIKSVGQIRLYLAVLFTTALAVNVYGFGQRFLNWPVISTMNEEFSKGVILSLSANARVNSTFAGHYDLAIFLAMTLVLGTAVFFMKITRITRFLLASVMACSFVMLLMTVSQIAYIAAMVGVMFVLFMVNQKKIIGCLVIVGLIAVFSFAPLRQRVLDSVFVNINYFSQKWQNQLLSPLVSSQDKVVYQDSGGQLVTYQEIDITATSSSTVVSVNPIQTPFGEIKPDLGVIYSSGVRFDVEWPRALRAFVKNPLLGTGYSSLGLSTDNDYLRLLGEVGILGFWAFGLVILTIIKNGWRVIREASVGSVRTITIGLLGVVVVFLTGAVFIDVFEASKIAMMFWIFAAMVCAARNIVLERDNHVTD